LRLGEFDVLVGVNLLREGLDIPEVSLVAILDADKEGFLRSERSLIQTSGRASRNISGKVIMYADKITKSIQACLDETKRRRIIQKKYNEENNITPESIKKSISNVLGSIYEADYMTVPLDAKGKIIPAREEDLPALIAKLTKEMKQAAKNMEFEHAAELRDELKELNKILLEMG
jgi:excinuclease ABC subunit B